MPRRPRFATGGYVFHVLNRSVGRRAIFQTDGDYLAFLRVVEEARRRVPMRLLSYCVMPNHWHLVVWPQGDDDLSEYMRWLTVTHTQRWHAFHETSGTGPIYQGRFKSFAVQEDDHFFTVSRYVERNALRANLARRAEAWRWSSLWQIVRATAVVTLDDWARLVRRRGWITSTALKRRRNCLPCARPSRAGHPLGRQLGRRMPRNGWASNWKSRKRAGQHCRVRGSGVDFVTNHSDDDG